MPRVNPHILRWARETAGLSAEQAVKKLGLSDARGTAAVDRLLLLESGQEVPSRALLTRMAKQYRRPLIAFYMTSPPEKGDRGQDFRNVPDRHTDSEALIDALVRDVRARQSIVRALLEDEDETAIIPFIGSGDMNRGVDWLVKSIGASINFNLPEFRAQSTPEKAFSYLRNEIEASGVFVLLIGNLGSHHTAIDVEAFRGFALSDPIAPFIIINDQDAKSAWSFTLIHELAHLWLGATGVSGAFADIKIERFCNDVASQFLLPKYELDQIAISDAADTEALFKVIGEFAESRHLSRSMVAYRLFSANLISNAVWITLSTRLREQWRLSKKPGQDRDKEGSPSYYVVRRHRIGRALLDLVDRSMSDGLLTPTKAGKVLGVKARSVEPLLHGPMTGRAA